MTTQKKEIIAISIIAVLLFGGGYVTGRYGAPERVVTTEKVVEIKQDHLVTTVDTDKILNAIKNVNTQKDVHTVRVIERQKDGTTKETVTTDDKTKSESQTKVQDKEKAQTVRVEDHLVYKDREITKIVERVRPPWSLSLQPGFEFGSALGLGGQPYNFLGRALPPGFGHVMANVTIERRLIGPLSIGAWANTHLDGGLSLRLEF